MAVVTFVPADFKMAFPAYASLADPQLSAFFMISELILDNTDASIVPFDLDAVPAVTERKTLLDLLVAHQAELSTRGAGSVGRVSSGSEGTVSGSFDMAVTGSSQWFIQTQWGATYWQATAKYRTARIYSGNTGRRQFGIVPRRLNT